MTGSEPPPKARVSHPAHTPPSGGPTRRSWLRRALSAMFATGFSSSTRNPPARRAAATGSAPTSGAVSAPA